MFQESDLYLQPSVDIAENPAYLGSKLSGPNNNINWEDTFEAMSAANVGLQATSASMASEGHYSHVPPQQLRHSISWGEEELNSKVRPAYSHHSHQPSEVSVSEGSDGSMASDASYFSAFSNTTTPAVPNSHHGYFSPPLTSTSEGFHGNNQYQWSPMDMMFPPSEFKMNAGAAATLVGAIDNGGMQSIADISPIMTDSSIVSAANPSFNYSGPHTYNLGKAPVVVNDLAALSPQSEDEKLLFATTAAVSGALPVTAPLANAYMPQAHSMSTHISPSDVQPADIGGVSTTSPERRASSSMFASPEAESPAFAPVPDEVRRREILRNSVCSKWVKLSKMTAARTERIRVLARAKNIDMETVDNVLTLYTNNKHRVDNKINRFDGDDVYIKITMGSGSTGINSDSDSDGDHSYTKKKQRKKRPDYVKRPLNSFMLYRKSQTQSAMAYATSSQLKLNHQNISQIIGLMWQTESKELKDEFASFAKQEKEVHRALHPDYKFCPQKKVRR